MSRLKVMTIVGTRPEVIRLAETIKCCESHFESVLVHTGQNWDYLLNQVFFKDLELREPDHYLDCAGRTVGETIGNIISKSYEVLVEESPDALLILGDTNSALSAIPAKRLKIPIFHMEAGNRCFDQNVPEEINRKLVDHISDVNLPYTEHSRRNLMAEGLRGDHIFVTGSPMREVLERYESHIRGSNILHDLGLERDRYVLVSAHREENIDDEKNFLSLMGAINSVAENYRMPVVYSTHPRSLDRLQVRGFEFHERVRSLPPFGFFDYNNLQINAFCVLSDSGTLAEESAILGFNGISLRTSTERPESVDKGSFIIGGVEAIDITQAIDLSRALRAAGAISDVAGDYQDRDVSVKVVKIIQSYTKIINRVIWYKV